MSGSGGIRGIRQVKRKKSSLSEVKLAVLGAPGVGKSGKFLLCIFFLFVFKQIRFTLEQQEAEE
jgi:hypothetical protein